MLFNLMAEGEAPGISLWCLLEKKQSQLGSANQYGSAVFDWYGNFPSFVGEASENGNVARNLLEEVAKNFFSIVTRPVVRYAC